jgi:uncharacterized protein YfdQ (DUF2303 family)
MSKPNVHDIEAAIEAGKVMAAIQFVAASNGAPVIVLPEGDTQILKLEDIEPWLERPKRKRGLFKFEDVDSFIRYFNEHKTEDSRIFATIRDNAVQFEGELDFHGDKPEFREHKCSVALSPTLEWKIWTDNNKKQMTQAQFAQFLEDNADLFSEPKGTDLLELVQTLEGKSHVNITQAVKLQNGAVKLNFTEDVELRGGATSEKPGDMVVPNKFKVSITPFVGVGYYSMEARLRYRIADRKISFWYETVAAHLVIRTIAGEVLSQIEAKTKVAPFKV